MAAISAPSVDPLRVTGVRPPSNSSPAAGIFFLGDGQSSAPRTSISGIARAGPGNTASPVSPNNLSGSSVTDSSSIPQQELMPKKGIARAMSQSMMQDNEMSPLRKRPMHSIRSEDVQRQQNTQLQSMIQMQRPPQVSPMRPPYESGLCASRLMQFMHHQRQRPDDNCISYWRKLTEEYFAPRSRKRMCFSLYSDAGKHALRSFPQAVPDAWRCGICGSRTGKGFEVTYEVLPRLNQIKFDLGVIDELWYLDMAHEIRLPSGMMVLEYAKAVQESVHAELRVVREGHLRIIFTSDLKILSWEFCTRQHEEFLPRRNIVHQVNQLLHGARKYQAAAKESGSSGVSVQDLQASCNMFVAAGRQMARNLDLQSLNDLGFSKRYVRCLQISEVVNSMKDLIDSGWSHKIGPIDILQSYTQQASANLKSQKIKVSGQADAAQNLPADQNTVNNISPLNPGLSRHSNPKTFVNICSRGAGSPNNYPINTPNPRQNPLPPHPSFAGFKQPQSVHLQGNGTSNVAGQTFQDMTIKNQQQQPLQGGPPLPNNTEPPVHLQGNGTSNVVGQTFQDMTIKNQQQQPLQGGLPLPNNTEPPVQPNQQQLPVMLNKEAPKQSVSAPNAKEDVKSEIVDHGRSSAVIEDAGEVHNGSGNSSGEVPGEVMRVMPDEKDASNTLKPDDTNNNCCDSSESNDSKLDVFENLDLGDLYEDFSLEFVHMFEW